MDVQHNLRFVKLSADVVDKSNVCFEGQRSQVFATLPVETQQRLFGTKTINISHVHDCTTLTVISMIFAVYDCL